MSNAIILDTETTGIGETHEVIEVAHLGLHSPLNPAITFEFEQRYLPTRPVSYGAMAVHHIMDEDLVGCPPTGSYELPEGTDYVIGYNIDFDMQALHMMDNGPRRIDLLPLCRRLWPDPEGGYTQSAMIYRVQRENAREMVRSAHSAIADIKMCRIVLLCVLDRLRERNHQVNEWEDLWKLSEIARIPLVMPFGKHKDAPFADVPFSYLQWCLGQDTMDPYVIKAVNRELKRRREVA